MNSYFATVEQQANPYLRGKPVGIRGSANKRTIVAAASIEAKRFGVKTAMRVDEAQAVCPEIILIVGEPRKYSHITKTFIGIFERYSDKIEIFSIDEAFLDVTKTMHLFGGAEGIARSIKKDLRDEIGPWLTCSVGISHNKFLAKLASDMQKPDGLIIITRKNKDAVLLSSKLDAFCGIGRRILRRLNLMGINTVRELRKADDLELLNEFGIYGLKLRRMAYGIDHSPVIDWRNQTEAKSFGHSRTLNKDVFSREELKKHIYLLSEKTAARMRREKYWGREISLWLRFRDFTHVRKSRKTAYWTCAGEDIYALCLDILAQLKPTNPIRAVGVSMGNVKHERRVPASLLPDEAKKEKILKTMDKINEKYGCATIKNAKIVDMQLKEVVSGLERKKF